MVGKPKTTKCLSLEKAIETMRSWSRQQERPTFNGKIVVVKEGEMIIDKVSGLTYVTEKTWEEMKAAFPRVEANSAGI